MRRKSLAASLSAISFVLAAPTAHASCGDRPATPDITRAEPVRDFLKRPALQFHWRNASRGNEKLYWDFEAKDGSGKIVRSQTGIAVTPMTPARHYTFSKLFTFAREGTQYCIRVRARTEASREGCVSEQWSAPACATTFSAAQADPAKSQACNRYASGAVGQVKLARETYKCDAATLSGPRWTSTFGEHLNWCMGAEAAARDRETAERTRIMHECRVKAAGPKGGKAQITVTSKAGDTFFITGSGFAPNAPVIIRLSGPGAAIATVTVANSQRIVADAKGSLSIRLFGAQICKRGGGSITFTAEDQDNHASPPATAKCAP